MKRGRKKPANPWLSAGAVNMVRRIKESKARELDFFKPGGWWIGESRVSGRYAWELLQLCLLRLAVGPLGSGHEVYVLSQDAEAVAFKNETPLLVVALREGQKNKRP